MKNVAYFFFVCITYLVVSIKQFNSLYALWNMVFGKVKYSTRRMYDSAISIVDFKGKFRESKQLFH